MREIKFRAWDKISKIFLDWEILKQVSFEDIKLDESKILLQFTGLKDKNGKEIYEGDIVKRNGFNNFIVSWNINYDGYVVERRLITNPDAFQINKLTNKKEYEIIGNIYENPELLK